MQTKNILEEYSVKIYEIDLWIYENYRKKLQCDENGCKNILFKIDDYFIEYLIAVESFSSLVFSDKFVG